MTMISAWVTHFPKQKPKFSNDWVRGDIEQDWKIIYHLLPNQYAKFVRASTVVAKSF